MSDDGKTSVVWSKFMIDDKFAWYKILTFGAPAVYAWNDEEEIGQGPSEFARLCRLAQNLKGTGSCTDARVARFDFRGDALCADISTEKNIVYIA